MFVPTSARAMDTTLGLKTPPWKELPPCIKASHMLTSFAKIFNNGAPLKCYVKIKMCILICRYYKVIMTFKTLWHLKRQALPDVATGGEEQHTPSSQPHCLSHRPAAPHHGSASRAKSHTTTIDNLKHIHNVLVDGYRSPHTAVMAISVNRYCV